MLTRESKKTPKGTAPRPVRRATMHKRAGYGLVLVAAKRKRDWRRYQGKPISHDNFPGDSNSRE